MQSLFFIFFIIIIINLIKQQWCANVFTFKMHHRLSDPVKNKLLSNGFPDIGTVEYYYQLAQHDRLFRGRRLLTDQRLTFSDGNSSFKITSLGFLHYTMVSLGTPGQKFLVALDTGSDLFWVPCECSRCASIDNTPYSSKFNLSTYDPKESSTSKKVSCNHRMCTASCPGSGTVSTCPYSSSYFSSETSTSGILIEDYLHLETDDSDAKIVDAFVTFGCGQVQSGSFLHVAAPNGLFGLGMEKISVPSLLAREGYIADSFSMCFGHDGTGRISFGDKGSIDQAETPFSVDASNPTYMITATQLRVGDLLINSSFTALFDSGTSFTHLAEPHYTRLMKMFHAQTKDPRRVTDKRIPFEYCYALSPESNTSLVPKVSLTMKGEHLYIIYTPVIVLTTHPEAVYCLAVLKHEEMNIIGQNFMTGYRIVYDREKLVLGWKKSGCYDIDNSAAFTSKPLNTDTVPHAVATGLEDEGNRTRVQSSAVSLYSTKFCCLTNNLFLFLTIHSFIVVIFHPFL